MHRIFEFPELLSEICSYLKRKNGQLPRVSKRFFGSIAPYIWEDVIFEKFLLSGLIPHTHTIVGLQKTLCKYQPFVCHAVQSYIKQFISNDLSASNMARVHVYGPMVKQLSFGFHEIHSWDPLVAYLQAFPPFPNLVQIGGFRSELRLFHACLCTSIRRISTSYPLKFVDLAATNETAAKISTRCPELSELCFHMP